MPKNTFYNLPDEKKNRILEAAMDEFASYSYSEASVNRVIKQSGIAVGSFYQYFEDLKDLYNYVIKMATYKKYEYLRKEIDSLEKRDFISSIKALYRGGIKFAFSDKRLFDIGNNMIKNKDVSLINEIYKSDASKEILGFAEKLFKEAIDRGEIRRDVSPSLIMNIILTLNTSMVEQMMLEKPDGLSEFDYNELADISIDIIINGIGAKPSKRG